MLSKFGSMLWDRNRKRTLAQTVAEYALIVALVAIASIGVLTLFGDQLRSLYAMMSARIAGQSTTYDKSPATDAQTNIDKSLDKL